MLHIAVISLAVGNLALVYGFIWMNRRIRLIEKKLDYVFRIVFHIPEEKIVLLQEQIISLLCKGDRHE